MILKHVVCLEYFLKLLEPMYRVVKALLLVLVHPFPKTQRRLVG